ncbi:hypothetical protein [Marinobacterium nitratireducens]|uniref:hypothetical protein n=1 Tax=Marinobacterium nitratireducens TaxID=518897 RepID=UPI0016695D21|nr:hypothetical protein [Marinobacterium nitratireducens]
MNWLILKVLIILFLAWLVLKKVQDLLSKWRLKRSGDPDAELVIDKSSGWNFFLDRFFGFLRLVVVLLFMIIVLTWWSDKY